MVRINKKRDEYDQKWIGKSIFLLIKIFRRYTFHNNVKYAHKIMFKAHYLPNGIWVSERKSIASC
jgi:hypothetical protein